MKFYSTLSTLIVVSASLTLSANAFSGEATFYKPGLGACGHINSASDLVVALPVARYGTGGHCFKKVVIHHQGKLVRATVVDKCPSCGPTDLDLSPAAFSQLADKSLGRIHINWEFL